MKSRIQTGFFNAAKTALFTVLIFAGNSARAAVPELINFQGKLTDSAGTAITVSVPMVFKFYTTATGGSLVWTENQDVVPDSTGLYSVLLGSATSFSTYGISFSTSYWLGVTVGTDLEMTPRYKIVSSAYALYSINSGTAAYSVNSGTSAWANGVDWPMINHKPVFGAGDVYLASTQTFTGANIFTGPGTFLSTAAFTAQNSSVPGITISSGLVVSAGNVGIGTDTPVSTLTIIGTFMLVDGSQAAGNILTSDVNGLATWQTAVSGGDVYKASTQTFTGDNTFNGGTFFSSSTYVTGGGIYSTGTIGGTPFSGSGTRFMWIPVKQAIRAGAVNGNQWDYDNIGSYSVAFGNNNTASSNYSIVAGGLNNTASGGIYATVGGGYLNIAATGGSTIPGGYNNRINGGVYATVMGGASNTANGNWATVAGGNQNTAKNDYSFAAGYLSSSTANGAFTWSDSEGVLVDNTVADRTWFKNRGGFLITNTTNAGASAFSVDSSGYVGVGTMLAPSTFTVVGTFKLIDGSAAAGRVLTSDANGLARWAVAGGGGGDVYKASTQTFTGSNTFTSTAAFTALNPSLPGITISSGLIVSAGNVGIGTNAPSSTLTVVGTFMLVNGSQAAGNVLTSDANGLSNWQAPSISGDVYLASTQTFTGANTFTSTTAFTALNPSLPGITISSGLIVSAGNVGIGTNAPSSTLTVVGTLQLVDGTQTNGYVLTSNAAGLASWAASPGDNLGNHIATKDLNMSNFNITNGTQPGNSNFIGANAGLNAASAIYANFFGSNAGKYATIASSSNFLGYKAGEEATTAANSNFLGTKAGFVATNASSSNFLGYNAGNGAIDARDSIFIGSFAGLTDTVDNTATPGDSSIAIGRYSGTGGYSNSIAIGHGVINSAARQLNIGNVIYSTSIYNSDTPSAAPTGGYVGIGTNNPGAELEVAGQVKITGGVPGAGKVLTSNADGLATWEAPGGGGGGDVYKASTQTFTGENTFMGDTYLSSSAYFTNGGIYSTGTVGGVAFSGAGTRFMWIPEKSAIRAGGINANQWNFASIGTYSVAFGFSSTASGNYTTVSGGENNAATNSNAAVGGGQSNTASGAGATVAGGAINTASNDYATVAGGVQNAASGQYSTVAGGRKNISNGRSATAGGESNTASNDYTTVAGGRLNVASAYAATVSGGQGNIASQWYATVPGGENNTAKGLHSFAAGRASSSTADGSFTWADNAGLVVENDVTNRTWFKNGGGFLISTAPIANLAAFAVDSSANVGIGTITPGASSLLDLTSTTKGFVLPRMTQAERNAIVAKVAGMMVYQTDAVPGLRVYNGTNWMRFTETSD